MIDDGQVVSVYLSLYLKPLTVWTPIFIATNFAPKTPVSICNLTTSQQGLYWCRWTYYSILMGMFAPCMISVNKNEYINWFAQGLWCVCWNEFFVIAVEQPQAIAGNCWLSMSGYVRTIERHQWWCKPRLAMMCKAASMWPLHGNVNLDDNYETSVATSVWPNLTIQCIIPIKDWK